jgi:hypothetical protein
MSPAIRNHAKLTGGARAVLAVAAFGPNDARAAFDLKDFSCATDPFRAQVVLSGLGNANICSEKEIDHA